MPFSDELIYEQLTKICAGLDRITVLLQENNNIARNQLEPKQPLLDAAQYVNIKKAAEITGLSKSFFDRARCTGNGPPYFKLGGGIRYKVGDLLAWCDTGKYKHTAQWGYEKQERVKVGLRRR